MGKSYELRAKLDERGIKWWPSDDPCWEDSITHWCVGPFKWTAIECEKDLWLNAGIAGHEPLTPEQAIAATVGRSCASCPEMDNPNSYISHLQSALKWHDEHVPRPTNPINTCVVLEGEKVPEEVLFIGANGVTHYLPEGKCEWCKDGKTFDRQTVMMTNHGWEKIRHCPNCGRRIGEVAE